MEDSSKAAWVADPQQSSFSPSRDSSFAAQTQQAAAAAVLEEPLPDTWVTEAGADVEVPLLVEVPSPPSDRKPFEVPGTITEQMTQAVKDQVLSQLPEGVQFDDFYPEAVISYASGKRPQDCV